MFRSALINGAGAATVWTPTSGKRARIKGWSLVVDPTTTSAAGSIITLLDGGTAIETMAVLAIAAPGVFVRTSEEIHGEGLRSAAVNNVIAVNLSAAATLGGVYFNIWGTEE